MIKLVSDFQLKSSLKMAIYTIFHPFNGFWDLKHEKMGSFLKANIILIMLIITFTLRSQFTGFVLNMSEPTDFNLFYQITSLVLPFLIWCIANWCITTLVDGEGNFRDIYITTAYALIPLILFNIPMVIISNIITIEESAFYSILDTASIIWSGFLLFSGILTIHQFSIKKTLLTIVIAILGMMIMIFILLLFFTLVQNMFNFCRLIWAEISIRLGS